MVRWQHIRSRDWRKGTTEMGARCNYRNCHWRAASLLTDLPLYREVCTSPRVLPDGVKHALGDFHEMQSCLPNEVRSTYRHRQKNQLDLTAASEIIFNQTEMPLFVRVATQYKKRPRNQLCGATNAFALPPIPRGLDVRREGDPKELDASTATGASRVLVRDLGRPGRTSRFVSRK
jgi:hypothetical protein